MGEINYKSLFDTVSCQYDKLINELCQIVINCEDTDESRKDAIEKVRELVKYGL